MSISVDDAYSRVAANKDKWATLPLQTKLDYLLEMKQIHETLIDDWAKLGAQVRGYGPDDYIGLSVAYGFGPYTTAGALSALTQTYTELVQDGKPREPNGVRTVGNQQVIDFYPYFTTDKIMHAGCKGELYLEPNKPIERAVNLTHKTSPICAILGAGNFEAPVDILTKLFVDNAVAVFKPNPVNELAQKTMLPKLFASIIRDGFLEIVIGGVEVGGQLLNHPLCDEALMTGGASTYDKIVWGPNTEEAKKSGKKLFSKKFEAELGAVSPWMIVPGEWTESELNHQVSLLVANKLMNSGAVCASPQVFIVDKDWPQRERFTELLKEKFRSMPNYIHYYPGTAQRCNQAKGCAHKFEEFVKDNTHEKAVNPIVFFDHPADSELHKNEAFAPVLCELACPTGNNVEAFLKHTLEYVNSDRLFGSLSCSVVIDPRTQKKHSAAFEEFIDKLEYGCIAVNEWGGFLNVIPGAPWGAFPKHTPENIQSGMGKVSNWLLYSNIQKAVFRSPFVSPGHMKAADKNTPLVIKRGAYLSSQPGVMRLLGVLSAKFLGW